MTKSHLFAAICGCLLVAGLAVFLHQEATAQQGPAGAAAGAQAAAPRIAMLDVSFVFKNHTGFKARTASLRTEVEQAQQRIKEEKESITKMIQDLKDLSKTKPGSMEVSQFEERIARRQADLEIQSRLQNKDFMQKEAQIYHAIYQELEEEVGYLATQNRIDAVLRFNGDPVDGDQPNEIIRNVNKQVVWFAQDLDITKIILDRLNRKYGGANPTREAGRPNRQTLPSPY